LTEGGGSFNICCSRSIFGAQQVKKPDDYSGEFIPDLELRALFPDALAGLWKLFAKLYIAMNGICCQWEFTR
jgi:hypothetical protein